MHLVAPIISAPCRASKSATVSIYEVLFPKGGEVGYPQLVAPRRPEWANLPNYLKGHFAFSLVVRHHTSSSSAGSDAPVLSRVWPVRFEFGFELRRILRVGTARRGHPWCRYLAGGSRCTPRDDSRPRTGIQDWHTSCTSARLHGMGAAWLHFALDCS